MQRASHPLYKAGEMSHSVLVDVTVEVEYTGWVPAAWMSPMLSMNLRLQ